MCSTSKVTTIFVDLETKNVSFVDSAKNRYSVCNSHEYVTAVYYHTPIEFEKLCLLVSKIFHAYDFKNQTSI